MKFRKIVVAGGGVLGSQIALMSAYTGHEVAILVRSEASAEKAAARMNRCSLQRFAADGQREECFGPISRKTMHGP